MSDVAFVYRSKWKQRYFIRHGGDDFVAPAQWDMTNRVWRAYVWCAYYVKPGADWWKPHHPADQMQRPTGPLCDGCHSVNSNPRNKA